MGLTKEQVASKCKTAGLNVKNRGRGSKADI